ncbi:hypothetical protein AAZX31_06G233400 [Glycine max]
MKSKTLQVRMMLLQMETRKILLMKLNKKSLRIRNILEYC